MTICKDNEQFRQITDISVVAQVIRSNITFLLHSFFYENKYMLVDPPVLHEQIPNKKHEIYLPLYENRYSLNSSNALYLAAYSSIFERVYAISSSFRAEQESINHLLEFRMLEVEVQDMSYDELTDFIERLIVFLLSELTVLPEIQKMPAVLKRIHSLLDNFHPRRISYTEFLSELRSAGYQIADNVDLSDIDYIVSQYIDTPVFIMDYPKRLATWTAKPKNGTDMCAINLILPDTYGELCEGCERTNDSTLLQFKMKCANIDNLQWYLDAVKKIQKPRCGFGIGIDRLVRWIVGTSHIKNTVLFSRMSL